MALPRKPQTNNNFFTKAIQRYGEDFINKIHSMEMKNATSQIFRELAKGRIDIQKHGHYFLDTQFLEICLSEAIEKLNYHAINYQATNWYINNFRVNSKVYLDVLEQNRKYCNAYNLIVTHFTNLKMTGDIGHIFALANLLRNFRNNI